MARTLEVTGNEREAWEILDELAGLYGDNGGDPDGNAWLPSGTISDDEAAEVIAAGLGRMVEVLYANDAAMRHYLGWPPLCEGVELDEDEIEQMKLAAEDETQGWAHYGAYGAMDSHWVFVPRQ